MYYSQCYLKQTKMISTFVDSYCIHTMILNTFETIENCNYITLLLLKYDINLYPSCQNE